jgi:hypothetical protein
MKAAPENRSHDSPRDKLPGGRMRRVALHDYWTPSREGGGGVATGNGKGEGEIRCAENRDGAERHIHTAQVRPWRDAIRKRGIDRYVEPQAHANFGREKAELVDSTRALAFQSRTRQAALTHGVDDQIVANRFDLLRDRLHKAGTSFGTEHGEAFRSVCSQPAGVGQILLPRAGKTLGACHAACRIEALKSWLALTAFAADQDATIDQK